MPVSFAGVAVLLLSPILAGDGPPGAERPARQEVASAVRALSSGDSAIRLEGTSRLLALRDRLTAEDLRLAYTSSFPRTREFSAFLLGLGSDPAAINVLAHLSLEDADSSVRSVAYDALAKRQGDKLYRSMLSAAVFAPKFETRLRALAKLEEIGDPRAVPALTRRLGIATGTSSAAGAAGGAAGAAKAGDGDGGDDGYIFSGTQTSLVTDFDVEVAQGAVIADPIVTPVTSGSLLRVRNVHVSIHQREKDALWAAILASSGRR
jgi:hypothetical protein